MIDCSSNSLFFFFKEGALFVLVTALAWLMMVV